MAKSTQLIAPGGATGTSVLAEPLILKNKYCPQTSAAPFSDWCRLIEYEGIVGDGPIWEYWWDVPGWYSGLNTKW